MYSKFPFIPAITFDVGVQELLSKQVSISLRSLRETNKTDLCDTSFLPQYFDLRIDVPDLPDHGTTSDPR